MPRQSECASSFLPPTTMLSYLRRSGSRHQLSPHPAEPPSSCPSPRPAYPHSHSDLNISPPSPSSRRVPSNDSIDDACASLLDTLDPDLLVPLDLPSDVPFHPRMSEVKVQPFLRAMLKCAPLVGRPYIIQAVLATRGKEARMQRLAAVWFNRIVFLGTFAVQSPLSLSLLLSLLSVYPSTPPSLR